MNTNRGFTLIELMIVMAIVGILIAIAAPIYSDYTARSQITEGLNLTDGAKVAVAEFYSENGTFPADNQEASLTQATDIRGKYVSSISVIGPIITIKYGNRAKGTIAGQTITLTATSVGGSIRWDCASAINENLLPTACR